MEPNWKEIGEHISDYVDNDEFLSSKTPQQICKILSYAKLTPSQFSTLFTNLSKYHGRQAMLSMLMRASTYDFKTREEVTEASETISSVLGIRTLNSIFAFSKNNQQTANSNAQKVAQAPPANPNTFKQKTLYILTATGKLISFMIHDPRFTVLNVKQLIQDKEGIPPDQQKLTFNGIELKDNKLLTDFGITSSCVINLNLRLRGAKPVIYLYPKEEIDAKVSIKIKDGDFSFVYPSFDEDNTWHVKAFPSGEIIHRGKKLRYLFWETLFYPHLNLDKGFVIKGEDTVSFFEDKLKSINLNDSEICDFITYWCPKLSAYKFIKISFQFENFDEICPMKVEPQPDHINRVFFAALPLDCSFDIEPQELPHFKRDGFTVIEWGGTIISSEYTQLSL